MRHFVNVEISRNLLNLYNDEPPKGFEGTNKGQNTPAGIHPRLLDLTAPIVDNDLLNPWTH